MQYHYAKVGYGASEYRTNRKGGVQEGLVLMKSPPPRCDWIANEDGTYSEVQKSNDELFAEEMDALNAEYDKNMAILANKYNIAIARDGSQETVKVESARAEISTLDAQYESDQLAILNKYYGA